MFKKIKRIKAEKRARETIIREKQLRMEHVKTLEVIKGKKDDEKIVLDNISQTEWVLYRKLFEQKGWDRYLTMGAYSEEVDLNNDTVEIIPVTQPERIIAIKGIFVHQNCELKAYIIKLNKEDNTSISKSDIKILRNKDGVVTAVFIRVNGELDSAGEVIKGFKNEENNE